MSSIRLFILDALSRHGEMHGHQLRQLAELERVSLWTDISVGGLYGALKRLAHEGLIAEVRTEQVGGYPERQIWAIADAGRKSLAILRQAGLREIAFRPDPFDLALARHDDEDPHEVVATVEARLRELEALLADAELHGRLADPYLSPVERRVMTHRVARLRAEIDWHEALLAGLPALLDAEHEWKQEHADV